MSIINISNIPCAIALVNATKPHRWLVNLVPGNGLVPSGNKSLSQSMFTQISVAISLRWRHNGHDSVSIYQPHDCLLNRLFRRRSKKTSKLRVTGLCEGNSPGTGEFPAQVASYVENVFVWCLHHDDFTIGHNELMRSTTTMACKLLSALLASWGEQEPMWSPISCWTNSQVVGDLICHVAHVMPSQCSTKCWNIKLSTIYYDVFIRPWWQNDNKILSVYLWHGVIWNVSQIFHNLDCKLHVAMTR